MIPNFSIFVLFFLLPFSIASYCGKYGVPYSFEVNPTGAPVLGCSQPSCVTQPDDFDEDSEFLTDAKGQVDGYFREGDRETKRYRHESAPKFVANCSSGFENLSCNNKNQWVGGIEYIDHPRQPLVLQCCSYDGLKFSQEVGTTVISAGEAVTGGEVVRNGRQISFDVIANVKKIVKSGKVNYEVTVRRMNCLPDPPEPEIQFDDDVPAEILKVLGNAKNGKDLGTVEKFEQKEKPNLKDKPKKGKKLRKASTAAPQQQALPEQPPQQPALPEQPAPVQPPPVQPQQPEQPPATEKPAAPISINMTPHKEPGQIISRNLPNPPQEQQPILDQQQPQPAPILQAQNIEQQQQPQVYQNQGPPPPQPKPIQNPQIQGVQNQPVNQPQQGLIQQGYPQQVQQGYPQQNQGIQPIQQQSQGLQNTNFGCQDGAIQQAVFQQQPNQPCYGVQPTPEPGIPTFPTLPPHTFPAGFPTLPPHTFPTGGGLPAHTFPSGGFPTLPPHTFPPGIPTLPPHTFPPAGGFPTHTIPPLTFPPGPLTIPPPTIPPGGYPTLPAHTFPPGGFPTFPPHTFPPGGFHTLPPHTFPPGVPTLPPHTFAPLPGFPGFDTPAPSISGSGASAFGVPSISAGSATGTGVGTGTGSSGTGIAALGAPSVSSGAAPFDLFGAAASLLSPLAPGLGGTLPTLPPIPGVGPTPAPLQPLPIAQPSGTQAQAQGNNVGAPDQTNLPQLNPTPELSVLEQQLRSSGVNGPVQTAGGFGPAAPAQNSASCNDPSATTQSSECANNLVNQQGQVPTVHNIQPQQQAYPQQQTFIQQQAQPQVPYYTNNGGKK